MKEPVKILWKYKNNNGKVQYNTYVFIGKYGETMIGILNKIKDIPLIDTWNNLTVQENETLEKAYGIYWYKKFYNLHHINHTIKELIASKNKTLSSKYGDTWEKNNIHNNYITDKKIYYNYESYIHNELERKEYKKNRTRNINAEPDAMDKVTDFRTNIHGKKKIMFGGNYEDDIDEGEENVDEEDVDDEQDEQNVNEEENKENDNEEDDDDDDDDDNDNEHKPVSTAPELDDNEEMEEIKQLYTDIDVESEDKSKETSTLLKAILSSNKTELKLCEFDVSHDNELKDADLRYTYKMKFITNQYIYKDDTIKTIKEKICASLANNPKYGEYNYITPSRQYLWTEYVFEKELKKLMIGQKWIRKSELLMIDIEPNNNIRYYTDLREPLLSFKENFRRQSSKIKYEDDSWNVLYDYDKYMIDDIYMIDVYNEIGNKYENTIENNKNMTDVYMRLYFPKIRQDEFEGILTYITTPNKHNAESTKIKLQYNTIVNDLLVVNEITNLVDDTLMKTSKIHDMYFKETFVTHTVIHLDVRIKVGKFPLDLYRLFDEYITDGNYLFVQYLSVDNKIHNKFNDIELMKNMAKKEDSMIINKWFEGSTTGISFKLKVPSRNVDKYMSININEMGRIEYKNQWKEENEASFDDIYTSYNHVIDLISKLNRENKNNGIEFYIPDKEEFKFAFINTIQRFELPDKYSINHNDLSEFSRLFFPYVSMVIDPRKRQSNTLSTIDDKGKYGTYLRYKRITKYDSPAKLEQRIMYYIRNYEYDLKLLSMEISKQFNITEQKAKEEIERIKIKYPSMKTSRKVLKKIVDVPKYKLPGVQIDIQGKLKDKYKIRISGARDRDMLMRIKDYLCVFIHLYTETYLKNIKSRQILKDKLFELVDIAKRRGKIELFVDDNVEIKKIKSMAKQDKLRIGFKPEEGQNQWSRSCQNSADNKRRRPTLHVNQDTLVKHGYKYNKDTGYYEKKAKWQKKDVIVKAIKVKGEDDKEMFYTCEPDENGEHHHIGFMTKSKNPNGYCMPCCFKKYQLDPKDIIKHTFITQCSKGEKEETDTNNLSDDDKAPNDQLYILQDTNKIKKGRLGYLPKYLDIYINGMLDKTRKKKGNYLMKTDTGYFFKYGSTEKSTFIDALAIVYKTTDKVIKDKCISILENDKNDLIYTSLNNGDIITQFGPKEFFIEYLKNVDIDNIDYNLIKSLISIPSKNMLCKNGINLIMFKKISHIVRKNININKEQTRDDFHLVCQCNENIYDIYNSSRDNVFMIVENGLYYPIVQVTKHNENDKHLIIDYVFKNIKNNIVDHVSDYYVNNCNIDIKDEINNIKSQSAREIRHLYNNIKYQYVDVRYKCKYLITDSYDIIPTKLSGAIYDVPHVNSVHKYLKNTKDTIESLNNIHKESENKIYCKPIGLYYDNHKNNTFRIVAILVQSNNYVPIIAEYLDKKEIDTYNLTLEHKELYENIDICIGNKENRQDERIKHINRYNYEIEHYELFRYEFSLYLSRNNDMREKIIKILDDKNKDTKEKMKIIKLMIYKLVNDDLYKKAVNALQGGKSENIVKIVNSEPDLTQFNRSNVYHSCIENGDSIHCYCNDKKCIYSSTKSLIIKYISKLTDELIEYKTKAKELLMIDGFNVQTIVDRTRFTERDNQKIINSNGLSLDKIIRETFGPLNYVTIGKKSNTYKTNYQQLLIDNPLKTSKYFMEQNIIYNNLTIYRAYTNSYYWNRFSNYSKDIRNLGYYSELQTNISKYIKSMIIEWLYEPNNINMIRKDLTRWNSNLNDDKYYDNMVFNIGTQLTQVSDCVVELYVVNKIQKIPIIVYNQSYEVIYIFDEGMKKNKKTNNDTIDEIMNEEGKIYKPNNCINIKFIFEDKNNIPANIEALYYIE